MRITHLLAHIAVLFVSGTAPLVVAVNPVAAQFVKQNDAYYTVADYTLNTDVFGYEVFVGKNTAFNTLPGTVTLTVADGARIKSFGHTYPDGKTHTSLRVFGNHKTNIIGGNVFNSNGFDSAIQNVSGGTVTHITANHTSTINILASGIVDETTAARNNGTVNIRGTVNFADNYDSGVTNIFGGSVTLARANNSSKINVSGGNHIHVDIGNQSLANISGGTVGVATADGNSLLNISNGDINTVWAEFQSTTNITGGTVKHIYAIESSVVNISGGSISANSIYQISDFATTNFFGLSIAYSGAAVGVAPVYGYPGVYYNVAWRRPDNVLINTRYFDVNGSVANATPQGVTFTLAAVTVPEPGTLLLSLPVVGLVCAVVIRRRKK